MLRENLSYLMFKESILTVSLDLDEANIWYLFMVMEGMRLRWATFENLLISKIKM